MKRLAQSSAWPIRAQAKFLLLFAVLAVFFAVVALPYVHRYQLPLHSTVGIYACFVALLALVLAPAMANVPRRPTLFVVLWCSPYLLYAAGTGDFRWLALAHLLVAAVPLPLLYCLFPVRDSAGFGWQDFIAAVWLIAVLLGHQLADIWNVPVNLDFMGRLFLIAIAAWTWAFLRPLPALGYSFVLSTAVLRAAGWNFLLFAIIAIPAGFASHFIAWNPQHVRFESFASSFIEIFLFIALLEELFFRGFLQTLISQSLSHPRLGQALASCLFGLFHILHAPFPNWRYVLLATAAGWFYGSAFAKTGSLLASALTHTLVDTLWRMFLSKT